MRGLTRRRVRLPSAGRLHCGAPVDRGRAALFRHPRRCPAPARPFCAEAVGHTLLRHPALSTPSLYAYLALHMLNSHTPTLGDR
jgi:hypothetical protein